MSPSDKLCGKERLRRAGLGPAARTAELRSWSCSPPGEGGAEAGGSPTQGGVPEACAGARVHGQAAGAQRRDRRRGGVTGDGWEAAEGVGGNKGAGWARRRGLKRGLTWPEVMATAVWPCKVPESQRGTRTLWNLGSETQNGTKGEFYFDEE